MNPLVGWILRGGIRRAFRSALVGRERSLGHAEAGRFKKADVDAVVDDAWQELATLIPAARLDRYPRFGTRLNAYLSVATLAGYRALRRAGTGRDYALTLSADAGWLFYREMIRVPRAVARLFRRMPQSRIDFIIRMLMRFPFAPPRDDQAPGYQVDAWKDEAGMHTHWTRCPPLEVFRELCEDDELDVFRGTWCRFDFPAAEAMAAGGRFIRPHVLSAGDSVCDMTWTVDRADASSDAVVSSRDR